MEHRTVLEKIMQKYREHVQQLQLMEEKEKIAIQLFNAGLNQVNRWNFSFFLRQSEFFRLKEIQEKTSKIEEMATVMQQAVEIDDRNSTTQEDRINALIIENRALRELLTVYQSTEQSSSLPTSEVKLT